jgi:hypothetical protein
LFFNGPMRAIKRKIKKTASSRKGRFILLGIALFILAAIAGGFIYWQTHKKQIIRNKLESAIRRESEGLYAIHYDSLELDELTGYISVKNISLSYDSLKYRTLLQQEKAPSILLNIHIPELIVSGVQTQRALLDREITGKKLEIKSPSIEIIYTMQGKDSARNVPAEEVYRQILGNLNKISIDTISITNSQIVTHNLKTKQKGIELTGASIRLVGLNIDNSTTSDSARMLFSREIAAGAEKITWRSDERPYRFEMNNISLASLSRTASIGSFHIDPTLGENAFVKSLPAQDDRFDFSFQNISVNNIDLYKLLEEDIIADNVDIASSSFRIYRDLNIPRDKKNRIGTYPSQILMKLPLPVDIKTMVLKSSYIEYKERNHITKKAGTVRFHDVYTTIRNLTNKKQRIQADNTMNININSRFMNKAPFKTSWIFYLGNSNGRFDIKGNLGSINAKDLNVLTEPMGPARMEDGIVKSLAFDLSGSNTSMNGTLTLLYDDVKVALLEYDDGEWDKKNVTSLFANIFIRNSNPRDKDKAPSVTSVSNQRDTNRSIFHLTWKTLFKGIKETMGIKK